MVKHCRDYLCNVSAFLPSVVGEFSTVLEQKVFAEATVQSSKGRGLATRYWDLYLRKLQYTPFPHIHVREPHVEITRSRQCVDLCIQLAMFHTLPLLMASSSLAKETTDKIRVRVISA